MNNLLNSKKIIFFLLFFSTCFFLYANDISSLFASNITKEELNTLASGQTVVRKLSSINKTFMKSNTEASSLIQEIKNRRPNYLAEIISIIPKSKCPTLYEQVEATILDVNGYLEIPYYSQQYDWHTTLYDTAELISLNGTNNKTTINYKVFMKPFTDIEMQGILTKNINSLSYVSYNTSTAVWPRSSLVNVKPGKMYSGITIYEEDEYYILYGVGALNAPSIFFLQERLETAFIGRIKSFAQYVFEQIELF